MWGNCGVSPQYGAVNCSNLNGTKDPVNIERKHTIRSGGKPREITQLGLLSRGLWVRFPPRPPNQLPMQGPSAGLLSELESSILGELQP